MKALWLLLLLLPITVEAASRDYAFSWEHDCLTVQGDNLDPDGDGICELINGWRIFYEPTRTLVTDIPDSSVMNYSTKLNHPFGDNCFYATAYMIIDTDGDGIPEDVSSSDSNIECKFSAPGNPNAPVKNPITERDRGIDRFLMAFDELGVEPVVVAHRRTML